MSETQKYDEEVWKLFDGYVHGQVSRRQFLDRAAAFSAAGLSAAAILESLSPDYARAQQVSPDDDGIAVSYQEYASPQGAGEMRGYLAIPADASATMPGVVVIHENRGLNPYVEDVARRVAKAGFIGFAPDALTPLEALTRLAELRAELEGKS
jgi:carboxymethylenebutenolidase